MNNVIKTTVALVATALIVGCGAVDDLVDSASGGSGSDKLTITKINDDKFDIVWEKGFDGYSEVVYKAENYPDYKLISNNYKGTHTLHCEEDATFTSQRFYSCTGTGIAFDGSQMDIQSQVTLKTNLVTNFHRRTSTNKDDQGIDYIVTYHSDSTLTVE